MLEQWTNTHSCNNNKIFEFITVNDTDIQHYKTMQLKLIIVSVLQDEACNTDTILSGNSTAKSQAPDDGYINVRNMLST